MQILIGTLAVAMGYFIRSIPFGLLIVKIKTGKDIREVESGRTGGTNVARAAGFWAGLLTAILDILKGAVAVWLAQLLSPAVSHCIYSGSAGLVYGGYCIAYKHVHWLDRDPCVYASGVTRSV